MLPEGWVFGILAFSSTAAKVCLSLAVLGHSHRQMGVEELLSICKGLVLVD